MTLEANLLEVNKFCVFTAVLPDITLSNTLLYITFKAAVNFL